MRKLAVSENKGNVRGDFVKNKRNIFLGQIS